MVHNFRRVRSPPNRCQNKRYTYLYMTLCCSPDTQSFANQLYNSLSASIISQASLARPKDPLDTIAGQVNKMGFSAKVGDKIRNDPNFPRLVRGIVLGAGGLRAGTGRYFSNKLPIVQWISVYNPRWIMDDALAGSSVGMLLLPQALVYSTIAGAPIQQAILASWLPGVIYALMGTSRGQPSTPFA